MADMKELVAKLASAMNPAIGDVISKHLKVSKQNLNQATAGGAGGGAGKGLPQIDFKKMLGTDIPAAMTKDAPSPWERVKNMFGYGSNPASPPGGGGGSGGGGGGSVGGMAGGSKRNVSGGTQGGLPGASGMGEALGGLGDAGLKSGNPYAMAAGAVAKLGEAGFKAVERLKDFADKLHDSNMQFAEFSGSMANVAAEQRTRDIEFSRQRGERRAESARYLAEGKSKLAENFAGFGDAGANLQNWLGGLLTNAFAKVTTPLGWIGDKLSELTSGSSDDKGGKDSLDAGKRHWTGQYGRPARGPRPTNEV